MKTTAAPLPQRTVYLRDNTRYQLVECIAKGLGTQVYKARDRHQEDLFVAIKRLEASHISLEGFFRELGTMQLLNQRYPDLAITTVLDWFWSERAWYLVMRFVEGQSLEAVLQRKGGALPFDKVLSIGLDLCAILSVLHLHERPVIHRDIKPANILRDRDGRIVLADFGTATFGDARPEPLFRGTSGYAAPEQSGGQLITPAADIYGLGATLYELLVGQLPPKNMQKAARGSAFRCLPLALQHVLVQMLEWEPCRRPASIQGVQERLQQAHAELPPERLLAQVP